MSGPARWGLRLRVLRALVFGYVAVWTTVRAPHLLDTRDLARRRFDPVGPLWFLEAPVPDRVVVAAVVLTPIVAVVAAVRRRPRLSGLAAALGFLFITTYRNSWGQLFHTENLAALHVVVLAAVALVRPDAETDDEEAAVAVHVLAVVTVATYALAGVAKLRIGGWAWVDGDVLRHQVAFDNARKELLGDRSAPLAARFLGQQWLLFPSAVATIVVELGAPLALAHRRAGEVWAATAFGFHVAILAVMAIVFPYHLVGIALAPLLPVERLGATVGGWRERFRRPSRSALPAG